MIPISPPGRRKLRIRFVEIVATEGAVGVQADDGVEEAVGVGQRVGLGKDRVHLARESGRLDPPPVLGRLGPEVGRPHRGAELLRKRTRSRSPSRSRDPAAALPLRASSARRAIPPSQSAFGPMRFSRIQAGSYALLRGKSAAMAEQSRAGGASPKRAAPISTLSPQQALVALGDPRYGRVSSREGLRCAWRCSPGAAIAPA